MAGVTSCPFKPTLTPTLSPPCSSSYSSFIPRSLQLRLVVRVELPRSGARPLAFQPTVVARYGRSGSGGGGGGYRPGGGLRRPPADARGLDSDDEALDISRITSSSVRLIDEQQNMVGIVSINEAIQKAEDAERDLVILSEDAEPPVLRIMDYNKFKYEQQKKKRDQQKKSAASRVDIKELKMGYNIDSHDYSVRLKAAQKFLKEGDKVKIIVNLKGRENEFRSIAIELIKRFQNDVGELATEEGKNFSDRNIYMILIPNKAALQKAQDSPKKKESTANKLSANM